MTPDSHSGFNERTRLAAARETLRDIIVSHGRTETIPLDGSAGRIAAEELVAPRAVPHYRRAAMDGYAVRAADTFGASERTPEHLRKTGVDADAEPGDADLEPEQTIAVHTGSPLPENADAVVRIEETDATEGSVAVFTAVGVGENVAPVGEDVAAGESLYEPGHRLETADLALLASVGTERVTVREPPTVSVLPTGEELVAADPGPGEVVETNGRTTARYADTWGANATNRGIVTDSHEALDEAITREAGRADLVVTTGGSSVGERDLVPAVVADRGEVLVHGVAIKPGHPVAIGVVEDTPILVLPGYPVSCIVTAVQLLRPAIKRSADTRFDPPPTVRARLDRKIPSEIGVRSFVRVELREAGSDKDASGDDTGRTAIPIRASGASVLSSVAFADGWIEVPESREGVPVHEVVAVQDWMALR